MIYIYTDSPNDGGTNEIAKHHLQQIEDGDCRSGLGHQLLGFQRFQLHEILGKCVSCSAVVQKPMGK